MVLQKLCHPSEVFLQNLCPRLNVAHSISDVAHNILGISYHPLLLVLRNFSHQQAGFLHEIRFWKVLQQVGLKAAGTERCMVLARLAKVIVSKVPKKVLYQVQCLVLFSAHLVTLVENCGTTLASSVDGSTRKMWHNVDWNVLLVDKRQGRTPMSPNAVA